MANSTSSSVPFEFIENEGPSDHFFSQNRFTVVLPENRDNFRATYRTVDSFLFEGSIRIAFHQVPNTIPNATEEERGVEMGLVFSKENYRFGVLRTAWPDTYIIFDSTPEINFTALDTLNTLDTFIRIRRDDRTFIWETSPDGVSYREGRPVTLPTGALDGQFKVEFFASTYNPVDDPGSAVFGQINEGIDLICE